MVKIVSEFPRRVRFIENTWITLSDGCRLAARIWLPEDAEDDPVPAVLNYIPYRKNEGAAMDAPDHRYVAGHGYAMVRVDIRGSGDSDGLLLGEYLKQEQDDGMEIISWIAEQPWCTGAVGMIGNSWGGFNGLQMAARRPPALKAVISVCSTDDRYEDDLHHQGGCVMTGTLEWASTMFTMNARPPDPRHVGDRWREMWFERMENDVPWAEEWLRHPRKDEFWKHGSVAMNYDDIQCPVYMVGGWTDAYVGVVPRFLANYAGPKKGLIGPWGHGYGHDQPPGPNMGFLQESLRWWDHWLKGADTGVMDDPMLTIWMPEAVPPSVHYTERPGRWISEASLPTTNVRMRSFYLNDHTVDAEAQPEVRIDHLGAQTAGRDAGEWAVFGHLPDWPADQRGDDALSISLTSPPLTERVEILGSPVATLTVASDRPAAIVSVRLCDVTPTGESTLITRRMLNLTHRNGDERPEPLEPGKRYEVSVPLGCMAYAVPPGHRLRLAVSPTYWPMAWPSPEPVTLSLFTGEASKLDLPVRSMEVEDRETPKFEEPEAGPPLEVERLEPGSYTRELHHDVVSGRLEALHSGGMGRVRLAQSGIETGGESDWKYSITEGDPLSASAEFNRTMLSGNGDWQVAVKTKSTWTCDLTHYHLTSQLEAFEGEERVFEKTWRSSIPRDI